MMMESCQQFISLKVTILNSESTIKFSLSNRNEFCKNGSQEEGTEKAARLETKFLKAESKK
jgi:hypothetical protein